MISRQLNHINSCECDAADMAATATQLSWASYVCSATSLSCVAFFCLLYETSHNMLYTLYDQVNS